MTRKALLMLTMFCLVILAASTMAYSPASAKKKKLPSSNFIVEIDGISTASFIYVEGAGSNLEVVEYREGNENNIIHLLPGNARAGPITLKRYLDDNSELWDWFEENRDDPVDTRAMSIVILDRGRNEQVRYNFLDCWPSEYYVEPLESKPSGVAVEVIVIQCESMERVSDDV